MTYFDQISDAIYNGTIKIPAASIKRGLKQMGLSLPLMVVAARPSPKNRLVQGMHQQKYFWYLHEGLAYVLWHTSETEKESFAKPDWLCGEPQFCDTAGAFIHQVQNAILSFRRVELNSVIRHQPVPLSFTAELDMRRLALGRLQEWLSKEAIDDENGWRNAVEVWLEIILLRHQNHLNTVQRKMDEFLCLMTGEVDNDRGLANCANRLQRELHQTYSLGELRIRFPEMTRELLREFPFSATLSKPDLSPISLQALEWIESHYHKPVSVAQCAVSIPVSAAYLCRLLKKETGFSPVQHLQQRRIAQAKVLLQRSRLSIFEIARRSGFGSTEHFYRVFKQHTNLAPAAYRRNVNKHR